MTQNRNKLIELLIGNLVNSVLHSILEKAINDRGLSKRYAQELLTSFSLAQRYREKINPVHSALPYQDIAYIGTKIIRKVKAELEQRKAKGYENLDISLVEGLVERRLKEMKITD